MKEMENCYTLNVHFT